MILVFEGHQILHTAVFLFFEELTERSLLMVTYRDIFEVYIIIRYILSFLFLMRNQDPESLP